MGVGAKYWILCGLQAAFLRLGARLAGKPFIRRWLLVYIGFRGGYDGFSNVLNAKGCEVRLWALA